MNSRHSPWFWSFVLHALVIGGGGLWLATRPPAPPRFEVNFLVPNTHGRGQGMARQPAGGVAGPKAAKSSGRKTVPRRSVPAERVATTSLAVPKTRWRPQRASAVRTENRPDRETESNSTVPASPQTGRRSVSAPARAPMGNSGSSTSPGAGEASQNSSGGGNADAGHGNAALPGNDGGGEGPGEPASAGALPEPTPIPTPVPQPTATPVPPTPTPAPTATPKPEPTVTPRPTATPEPTATPRPAPTATPRPEPTATPRPKGPTRDARPISQPRPSIPESLRSEKFRASVPVTIEIGADGSSNPSLRGSSGNEAIDANVLAALRRWRWEPALRDGEAVPSVKRFRFEFEVR